VSRRWSALLASIVAAVCVYAIVRLPAGSDRPVRTDVVQGALVGVGLAVVTVEVLSRVKAIKVNGWVTMPGCGVPGNGFLTRAACTWMFPGPVNVPDVPNPIRRYSVSDRSSLAPNADGSVDVYIQTAAPVGHESNWLPAPSGRFTLWLRVYRPGQVILDGGYVVPPVTHAP
jgi:hypothetical protein